MNCECAPDEYPRYLERALDVDKKLGGFFAWKFLTPRIVNSVAEEMIIEHLSMLSTDIQVFFQSALDKKKAKEQKQL